jgi:hypothetical protein
MFFSSCKTTKEIKVVYKVVEVDFPDFPKLPDYEVKNGKVTTDEEYFRQLLIFRELYKSERNKYNEKKEKLEAENE